MVKLVALILSILLISFSLSTSNDLSELTPVEDPFEFQNEYYPITVGNYWKMAYYTIDSDYQSKFKVYFNQTIIDYTFHEIYFGDSLYYLPVFRQKVESRPLSKTMDKQISYNYLIKTKQGILISTEEPKFKKFKTRIFIPQDSSYDSLSEIIAQMKIVRDVNVNTGTWELNCLKIEWIGEGDLGNYFYSKGLGHVLTQHFRIIGNKARPSTQFILEEYLIH